MIASIVSSNRQSMNQSYGSSSGLIHKISPKFVFSHILLNSENVVELLLEMYSVKMLLMSFWIEVLKVFSRSDSTLDMIIGVIPLANFGCPHKMLKIKIVLGYPVTNGWLEPNNWPVSIWWVHSSNIEYPLVRSLKPFRLVNKDCCSKSAGLKIHLIPAQRCWSQCLLLYHLVYWALKLLFTKQRLLQRQQRPLLINSHQRLSLPMRPSTRRQQQLPQRLPSRV